MKVTENSLPKSNILRILYKPSRYKVKLIALTSVELDGIIIGFKIFALHIRIFRVKKVGPTQAVKETCIGNPNCRI